MRINPIGLIQFAGYPVYQFLTYKLGNWTTGQLGN
jgi:hypothetical protein